MFFYFSEAISHINIGLAIADCHLFQDLGLLLTPPNGYRKFPLKIAINP